MQGTRADAIAGPVDGATTRTAAIDRSTGLDVTFAPNTVTVIEMNLKAKGAPYWSRPDLGIAAGDVRVSGRRMTVTVHSLGAVDAPSARVVLRDRGGRELAAGRVPALAAPLDLHPRTATVTLSLPAGAALPGGSVTVEAVPGVREITQRNNRVVLADRN
jgi:hypothetical protein